MDSAGADGQAADQAQIFSSAGAGRRWAGFLTEKPERETVMTISIGTSAAPSAWDTHAAWLRQREDSIPRSLARAGADGTPDHLDMIARMTPPGMAGVLSTAEVL